MIREFTNNVNASQDTWCVSDPFYFVRIDAVNHGSGGIQRYYFSAFEKSESVTTETENFEDFNWTKMVNSSSNTSMTLTKSITLPAEGYYLVELMMNKKSTASRTVNIDLSVDGTSILNETGYREWNDHGVVIKCPVEYLTSGSHTFVLTLPKYVGAGWIKISQLTRYEGGKQVSGPSETRLDLLNAGYTKNGVNDLDYLTLKVAMKPDYFTEEMGNNPLCFDLGDSVTLSVGNSMFDTQPVFGGYVQGWEINDDLTELTITCIDRLWDLSRNTVWRNFYIGTPPKDTNTGSFNYTQFSSVNQIARYLSTSLYEIDYNSITREYILYNSFSDPTDVTGLTSSGFDAKLETSFGHPGTCMRIIPTQIGTNTLTLWSDTSASWDAAVYNTFGFDYYASGAGVKYPLSFNIEIDMYKTGETASNAKTYTITFNGPTPSNTSCVIDDPTVTLDGTWQRYTTDLDKLFDKKAPSTNYYISAIRIVGEQKISTVLNRRCSSLYIDNIIGFTSISKAPSYKSADSKTALEELQDLCEKTSHFAYTRPGMERCDDVMMLLPKAHYTIPVAIDSTNIIGVSNVEYKPAEWGIMNTVMDSYNLNGKTSIGYLEAYSNDSEKHYGVLMDHEFHQDVGSAASVQTIIDNKIKNNSFFEMGFDVKIKGTSLLEPGQYVTVNYPLFRINGSYLVTAITHELNFVDNTYTSELSFTTPSGTYTSFMSRLKKALRNQQNINGNTSYATAGAIAAGYETSLGAYS